MKILKSIPLIAGMVAVTSATAIADNFRPAPGIEAELQDRIDRRLIVELAELNSDSTEGRATDRVQALIQRELGQQLDLQLLATTEDLLEKAPFEQPLASVSTAQLFDIEELVDTEDLVNIEDLMLYVREEILTSVREVVWEAIVPWRVSMPAVLD